MSSKKLSKTAEVILKERYYNPGEDWQRLCRRVAKYIDIDGKYEDQFFEMMYELDFLPNSPTLMNAGTELKNLSACFILPIPDYMDGIFNTLKVAALIQASGGGTGFDLSDLRPKGSRVSSTGGVTSGPISFLRVYDSASNVIKQGGKRRAANMAIMRCDHLDIKEFIRCKAAEDKITNFNVSVAATDDFMRACEEDTDWKLDFNTHNLEPITLPANELMDMIINGAWKNGEPGLFFIDTANRLSSIDERIVATNPCIAGESRVEIVGDRLKYPEGVPIKSLVGKSGFYVHSYCNKRKRLVLGKVSRVWKTGRKKVYRVTYQWKGGKGRKVLKVGSICVTADHEFMMRGGHSNAHSRFIDGEYVAAKDLRAGDALMPLNHKVVSVEEVGYRDVYDMEVEKYHNFAVEGIIVHNCGEIPLPPYGSCNLGSINLSQCVDDESVAWDKLSQLIHLGIRFLDDVVERNEYIIPEIGDSAKKYRSLGLGIMGWADMLLKMQIRYGSDKSLDLARRIGSFVKKEAKKESWRLCKKRGENSEGKDRRNAMLTSIAPTGTISMLAGCSSGIEPNFAWTWQSNRMDRVFEHFHPLAQKYLKQGKELPDYFVTAFDVSPSDHVRMQAVWQENIDHSISKTINLPNDATRGDIRNVFFQAWKLGCKGITVYRDGSRREQVLVSKTKTDIVGVEKVAPIKRPEKLYGTTIKQQTKSGTVYTTVNFISDAPVEVFLNTETRPTIDGLGRLISLSLRSNISAKEVIEQLKQSGGVVEVAVANAIDTSITIEKDEPCPNCGVNLVRRNGCRECLSCGWSACTIS